MGNKNSSQKKSTDIPQFESNGFFDFDPKLIYTRGISRTVLSFWTKQVTTISKPVLYHLNHFIIEKFCNEFPQCKDKMNGTTDVITHISTVLKLLSQTHCDSTQILQSTVLLNIAELCSKNAIEIADLIHVWKEISPMFVEVFSNNFNVSRQYCFDVVVLYLISLLEYRNTIDTNHSANGSVDDSESKGNDENHLSLHSYSISSTYDSCKTKEILSDLITLRFLDTTQQCLTHSFGCEYLCDFITGIACVHPELVWFYKDLSDFTTIDSKSDTYITEAASIIATFLYENAPNSLVLNKIIQPATAQTALQLCQKNKFRLAFNVMYIGSLQWCDEKQLKKFRECLTKDLKL